MVDIRVIRHYSTARIKCQIEEKFPLLIPKILSPVGLIYVYLVTAGLKYFCTIGFNFFSSSSWHPIFVPTWTQIFSRQIFVNSWPQISFTL